jgi:hypothetical protein
MFETLWYTGPNQKQKIGTNACNSKVSLINFVIRNIKDKKQSFAKHVYVTFAYKNPANQYFNCVRCIYKYIKYYLYCM